MQHSMPLRLCVQPAQCNVCCGGFKRPHPEQVNAPRFCLRNAQPLAKLRAPPVHRSSRSSCSSCAVPQMVLGYAEPLYAEPVAAYAVLQIIEVILNAPFHATKAALPAMIDAGWGRVVNTGACAWEGPPVGIVAVGLRVCPLVRSERLAGRLTGAAAASGGAADAGACAGAVPLSWPSLPAHH